MNRFRRRKSAKLLQFTPKRLLLDFNAPEFFLDLGDSLLRRFSRLMIHSDGFVSTPFLNSPNSTCLSVMLAHSLDGKKER